MVSFLTQVYIPGYFLRTYLTGAWQMSNDPLLQPYQLKHLTLRNRIIVTAHEPAYPEDGMPKARYRAYTVERAKGGGGTDDDCGLRGHLERQSSGVQQSARL